MTAQRWSSSENEGKRLEDSISDFDSKVVGILFWAGILYFIVKELDSQALPQGRDPGGRHSLVAGPALAFRLRS